MPVPHGMIDMRFSPHTGLVLKHKVEASATVHGCLKRPRRPSYTQIIGARPTGSRVQGLNVSQDARAIRHVLFPHQVKRSARSNAQQKIERRGLP